MKEIKPLIGFTSIEKLNISISIIFIANQIIRSTLLWLVFFILWEILLFKLFDKYRKKKKYLFSYVFIAVFIGVFCLKAWFAIKLYHSIV